MHAASCAGIPSGAVAAAQSDLPMCLHGAKMPDTAGPAFQVRASRWPECIVAAAAPETGRSLPFHTVARRPAPDRPNQEGLNIMSEQEYRIEHDSMGDVRVPTDALYGAQTQRAVENFPISDLRMPRSMIRALGMIKAAAAAVNNDLGLMDDDMAAAIQGAAMEVAEGEYDGDFPIDIFQTGSGTSSNMNANEVIAALASRTPGCARARQRPCQHGPEQQRCDSDGHPCGRLCGCGRATSAGVAVSVRDVGGQRQTRSIM